MDAADIIWSFVKWGALEGKMRALYSGHDAGKLRSDGFGRKQDFNYPDNDRLTAFPAGNLQKSARSAAKSCVCAPENHVPARSRT